MPNSEEVSTKEQLSSEQNIFTNDQTPNINVTDNTYLQTNSDLNDTSDSSFDGNFTQSSEFVQSDTQSDSETVFSTETPTELPVETQIPAEYPEETGAEQTPADKEKNFNNMLRNFSMQSRGKIREVRDREAYVPPSLKEKIKSEKARRRDRKSRRRQH